MYPLFIASDAMLGIIPGSTPSSDSFFGIPITLHNCLTSPPQQHWGNAADIFSVIVIIEILWDLL